VQESFRLLAQRVSEATGSPWAFLIALVGVLVWAVLGPYFHFAETWWLIASTVCSVIPTLMVFLIQNMQNRDSKAMQLKLDELIRATAQARNHLIHLESLTDSELERLEGEFKRVRGSRSQVPNVAEASVEPNRGGSGV
jgi:low affinity Fe/Cu permease